MTLHTITTTTGAGGATVATTNGAAASSGRRRRLSLAAVAGSVAALAVFAAPAGGVDAAIVGDRQSPHVVAAASAALTSYEQLHTDPSPSSAARFQLQLIRTAELTAVEVGVDPAEMREAWLAADGPHQIALLTGLSLLGTDYRTRGDDPDEGFDCSGFTSWAWRAAGVELPRSSGDQISAADTRSQSTAMAGDLVQYPGHVMMYLGVGNVVVHSSTHDKGVELWALSTSRSYNYGDPTS